MKIDEYIAKTRQFSGYLRPLLDRALIEEQEVARHSVSADEKKARDLVVKLASVLEALHHYDEMGLPDIRKYLQLQMLAAIDHKVVRVRLELERILKNPPQRAADLLIHSDAIHEIHELSNEYREELTLLERALKNKFE